jgi:hypothetical protein
MIMPVSKYQMHNHKAAIEMLGIVIKCTTTRQAIEMPGIYSISVYRDEKSTI